MASKSSTTVNLEQWVGVHLEFTESPAILTSVEIENVFGALTYLHDSLQAEVNPKLVVDRVSNFGHPRNRLRTDPAGSLRIESFSYGSPAVFELLMLGMGLASSYANIVGAVTGTVVTIHQADERHRSARNQERGADEAEGGARRNDVRTDGVVEVNVPADLLPQEPYEGFKWDEDPYFDGRRGPRDYDYDRPSDPIIPGDDLERYRRGQHAAVQRLGSILSR